MVNVNEVKIILIFFQIQILITHCLYFQQDDIDKTENTVHKLESKLRRFGDEILGITNIEKIYDDGGKTKADAFNATKYLNDIVNRIGSRLNESESILRTNKEFMEKYRNKRNSTSPCPACCTAYEDKLRSDVRFGQRNYPESCCGNNQVQNQAILWNESSILFSQNLQQSPFLLWQYFGDINGNYIQYPTDSKMCKGNVSLDARFQDWYVYTASPKKKNVVVIIDASGSMSMAIGFPDDPNTPTRRDIAKEAAKTVLDTLSPTDYAGIVAFNDSTRSSKCTNREPNQNGSLTTGHDKFMVIQATKSNKKTLRKFINSISSTGSTYYGIAFQKAFELLNQSKDYNPKQFEDSLNMILFLTDGAPNEKPKSLILEEIAKGQKSMNNSVYIFVYGFGREINGSGSNTDKAFLIKLADQNNLKLLNVFGPTNELQWPILSNMADNSKPSGPAGNYFFISDSGAHKLKDTMGKYYAQFPMSKHREPRISLPYTHSSVGQVVTLGLPTVDASGDFFGVVSLDISVGLTFYDVQHFSYGKFSYAFLVGDSGKVLIHPDLPEPFQLEQQPTFYRVDQIEPDLSPEAVRNITNGIPGEETLMKSLFNPRRKSRQTKQATYLYQPVPGFEGTYSIVMVIFDEDLKVARIKTNSSSRFTKFLYHRLDHLGNDSFGDYNVCSRDNMLVLPENTTIKFSPGSFTNPEKQLMFEQNSSYSELLMNMYNNSKDFTNHTGITDPAFSDVLLTYRLDPYWMKQHDVIWRYLGTENGLFKVYPGTLVPDSLYDPREDTWYRDALERKLRYIFTDTSHTVDSNTIITIAKAFHYTKNSVHGVIAADISKQHFITFLYNTLGDLTRPDLDIYVFDQSGYSIAKLMADGKTETYPIKEHMSHIIPQVAEWLINQGILIAAWCTDIATGHSHLTYNIDTNGQAVVPITTDPCLDMILMSVNSTNLYILVHKQSTACDTRKLRRTCPCTLECSVCSSARISNCQCPCTCKGSPMVDTCLNTIDHSVGYMPCSGNTKHWRTQRKISNTTTLTNVTNCQQSCTSVTNATQCRLLPGCSWCQTGHYKLYPLCSESCVHDRLEVILQSPCTNLTSLTSHQNKQLSGNLFKYIVNKTSNIKAAKLQKPIAIDDNTIKFYIENLDESNVPLSWIVRFADPFTVSINVSGHQNDITFVLKDANPTDYRVTLHISGINFTSELQTALTLRSYVKKVIKDLTKKMFSSEVANTAANVWLEEGTISFIIGRPLTMKSSEFLKELENIQNKLTMPVELDLLGRKVKLYNITTRGSFQSSCHRPCHEFSSADNCNDLVRCHWDNIKQKCTATPLLPERIRASIYFPCMGLYRKLNDTDEDELLTDFKQKLVQIVNISSNDSLHSFHIVKNDKMIGRQIDFTIQGRLQDPSVSETWWKIKHALDWNMNFTISNMDFECRSSILSTSYEEFTSMQIIMVIPSLDVDEYLEQHPLTGRREIIRSVRRLAQNHLLPQVSNTITNVWMKGNLVPFLISKPAFDTTDLRSEYTRLKQSVENGLVTLHLDGNDYRVNDTFFVGSFWQLCPRTCDMVETNMECSSIQGCYWSDLETPHLCTDDSLLQEKVTITVLYPCAGLNNLTKKESHGIITTFESDIRRYLNQVPPKALHSFSFGEDYGDSLVFTIQATLMGPALSTTVANITEWISQGHLLIKSSTNNSFIQGEHAQDYDSVEVALEYNTVDFDNITPRDRDKLAEYIRLQVSAVLPLDVVLLDRNVWFDQKYAVFTLARSHKYIKLEEQLKRIKKIIKLGGVSVSVNGTVESPVHVKYQNRLTTKCPPQCLNSTKIVSQCTQTKGCFYNGTWHIEHCSNNTYLSNRYLYQLFIPCNVTQKLNSSQKQEAEMDLFNKLQHVLDPVPQTVITDVHMQEEGADVTIQATTLYPHLDHYIETLNRQVDYKFGFMFGPINNPDLLVPRKPQDFTNVDVKMCFSSIDFNAMKSSTIASDEIISKELNRHLNRILLGEISQSFRPLWINQECILFELTKDQHSVVSMADQVQKIRDAVSSQLFILDLHYIRPVKATSVAIKGTFKQLCPEKYPEFTSVSPTPTIVTNYIYNYTAVTTDYSASIPSVILMYNSTEVSRSEIQHAVDSSNMDTCFVDIKTCSYCVTHFSRHTCTFDEVSTVTPTHAVPTLESDMDTKPSQPLKENHLYIGPIQITIITVSSFFMLTLGLWAIDYVRHMKKKGKKQTSPTINTNKCAGTGGRSIEVIPEEN